MRKNTCVEGKVEHSECQQISIYEVQGHIHECRIKMYVQYRPCVYVKAKENCICIILSALLELTDMAKSQHKICMISMNLSPNFLFYLTPLH